MAFLPGLQPPLLALRPANSSLAKVLPCHLFPAVMMTDTVWQAAEEGTGLVLRPQLSLPVSKDNDERADVWSRTRKVWGMWDPHPVSLTLCPSPCVPVLPTKDSGYRTRSASLVLAMGCYLILTSGHPLFVSPHFLVCDLGEGLADSGWRLLWGW